MHIAVGSLKEYKLSAATAACERLIHSEVKIHGVRVESGVSAQPMSNSETILGARNRAITSMTDAPVACEIAIGIENGLVKVESRWFATTWIIARDRSGKEGMAATIFRPVPLEVMNLVEQGHELSFAMRQLYGRDEQDEEGGLIGMVTMGILQKHDVLRDGIVTALSPLFNHHLFKV